MLYAHLYNIATIFEKLDCLLLSEFNKTVLFQGLLSGDLVNTSYGLYGDHVIMWSKYRTLSYEIRLPFKFKFTQQ